MVYPPENRECPSSSLLCSSGGAAFIVNPSSASSSFFSTIHPSCSNCPFPFLVPCCFHGNPNGIVRPLFPLLPLECTLLPRFQSSHNGQSKEELPPICTRSVPLLSAIQQGFSNPTRILCKNRITHPLLSTKSLLPLWFGFTPSQQR